jgi:uncharacterized repeat protein (TIGR03803 family)
VIDVKGTLYGTTYAGGGLNNGTVFTLDLKTGKEKVLHSFGCSPDGINPEAGLIEVKGTLYGTTVGGDCGSGTIFAVDLKTDALDTLYTFCSQANCTDGGYPYAGLIDVNGTLYGTTFGGGGTGCNGYGCGTAFSFDLKTGAEKVLYSSCSQQNCTDGASPEANLIDVNGTLYGTTQSGGTFGHGTVFALNPANGTETVLYSFCRQQNCTDGASPEAGLIDVNGTLYGTTLGGGPGGATVFAVNPNTGAETVVYSFGGAGSSASLIEVNGTLYGTTVKGGGCGCGTVFAFNLNTGAETVLHSFSGGTDGETPRGGLIDVKGTLYGATVFGGAGTGCGTGGCGTVFSLTKKP